MRTLKTIVALHASLVLLASSAFAQNDTSLNAPSTDDELRQALQRIDLSQFNCIVLYEEAKLADGASRTAMSATASETDSLNTGDPVPLQQPADPTSNQLPVSDDRQSPDVIYTNDSLGDFLPGDFNGDGVIGIEDLLIVLAGYGACSPTGQTECSGDVNGDGFVNDRDVMYVISHWS